MQEGAPEATEPSCHSCSAALGARARFCPRCGALQEPMGDAPLDPFARAAVEESMRHGGHARDPSGVVAALVVYGVCLALSVANHLIEKESVAWDFGAQLALLVIAAIALLTRWRDHRAAFRAPALSRIGFLLATVVLGVVFGVVLLLSSVFPTIEGQLALAYRAEGYGLGAILLSSAVLPAIGEELLFRVVILGALARALPEATAALISALLFASLHVSPLTFVAHAALGLLFAYTRLRSGSVYPCMVMHAAYNAAILTHAW